MIYSNRIVAVSMLQWPLFFNSPIYSVFQEKWNKNINKMRIPEFILSLPLEKELASIFNLLFSPINGYYFLSLWKEYDLDESGMLDSTVQCAQCTCF